MTFALWVEFRYEPPLWVYLVTTLPLLILLLLRPITGWLVCSQYLYKAEDGRREITDRPTEPLRGGEGLTAAAVATATGPTQYTRAERGIPTFCNP